MISAICLKNCCVLCTAVMFVFLVLLSSMLRVSLTNVYGFSEYDHLSLFDKVLSFICMRSYDFMICMSVAVVHYNL